MTTDKKPNSSSSIRRAGAAAVLGLVAVLVAAVPLQESPLAVVVRVEGDVAMERADEGPVPAAVGMRLIAGDRLVPGEEGRAVVVSRTGTRQEIAEAVEIQDPGPGDDGDLFSRTVGVLARAATADTRNVANRQGMIRPLPGEPTPLAPRNGIVVMDVRPTFRWAAVEGAEAYTIQIRRPDSPPVRHRTGADTVWTLPPEAAPLLPGETYRWTVAPEGGRPAREQDFLVAGPETYGEVAAALGVLREMGMDPSGEGLLLAAIIYLDSGLLYDADATLDQLQAGGDRVGADFWLLRGEVYAGLGRLEEARASFDHAARGER